MSNRYLHSLIFNLHFLHYSQDILDLMSQDKYYNFSLCLSRRTTVSSLKSWTKPSTAPQHSIGKCCKWNSFRNSCSRALKAFATHWAPWLRSTGVRIGRPMLRTWRSTSNRLPIFIEVCRKSSRYLPLLPSLLRSLFLRLGRRLVLKSRSISSSCENFDAPLPMGVLRGWKFWIINKVVSWSGRKLSGDACVAISVKRSSGGKDFIGLLACEFSKRRDRCVSVIKFKCWRIVTGSHNVAVKRSRM